MAYTIPETTRNQWHKLAQSAGLSYATIVGQHIYDLEGLIRVLEEELQKATNAQPGTSSTTSSSSSAIQPNIAESDSPYQSSISTPDSTLVGNDTTTASHQDLASAKAVNTLAHKLAVAKEQLSAYQLEQKNN